jgi:hypothetical protein
VTRSAWRAPRASSARSCRCTACPLGLGSPPARSRVYQRRRGGSLKWGLRQVAGWDPARAEITAATAVAHAAHGLVACFAQAPAPPTASLGHRPDLTGRTDTGECSSARPSSARLVAEVGLDGLGGPDPGGDHICRAPSLASSRPRPTFGTASPTLSERRGRFQIRRAPEAGRWWTRHTEPVKRRHGKIR